MESIKSKIISDIERQARFYDEYWQKLEFAGPYKLIRCAEILRMLSLIPKARPKILDLGCGTGWLTAILRQFGPATGVELSSETVQTAQTRYPHVPFKSLNIVEWQYPVGEYDVVVSQEVLEHIEDQQKYLEVAAGVLQDEGYLILTTPNRKMFYSAMTRESREARLVQPIEKLLSIRELREAVGAYFEILELKTVIFCVGRKGLFNVLHSCHLRMLLHRWRLSHSYFEMLSRFNLGLHTVLLARKKKTSALAGSV